MRIAVMQPYVFPYIGYFQLINATDTFVFYDDVHFKKKGYINRNSILLQSKPYQFTIPCEKVSQNKLIKDIVLNFEKQNQHKFLSTLKYSYHKAPYFEIIYPLMENFVLNNSKKSLAVFAMESIKMVLRYLNLDITWKISSIHHANSIGFKRTDRLIHISKMEMGTEYINMIGGKTLYDKTDFLKKGIKLKFLKSGYLPYHQFNDNFIPNLSIIDVLMFNSISEIKRMINDYQLS